MSRQLIKRHKTVAVGVASVTIAVLFVMAIFSTISADSDPYPPTLVGGELWQAMTTLEKIGPSTYGTTRSESVGGSPLMSLAAGHVGKDYYYGWYMESDWGDNWTALAGMIQLNNEGYNQWYWHSSAITENDSSNGATYGGDTDYVELDTSVHWGY